MFLFHYDSTNFLRQKRSANCEIRSFSVFIHYLFLRLQTEIFQIRTEIQIQTEIFQLQTEIFQLQTEIFQLQTEIFQIRTEIFQIQTEIFQIQTEIQIRTEKLCFPCLQLTASLACTPLLHFPLKSFSSQKFFLSKLSMLFCRNLNIKTYFCMRKDQLMSPERTSLAP